MTSYAVVRYIRWRKPEGEWPRWGPYMVIRRQTYTHNTWYDEPLARPQIECSVTFGFNLPNTAHLKLLLGLRYDEYYWEVW